MGAKPSLFEPGSTPLLGVAHWVVEAGLTDLPMTELLAGAVDRLIAGGIPVWRVQVAFRILHPLFDSVSITWTDGQVAKNVFTSGGAQPSEEFRRTPFFHLIDNGLGEARWRLDQAPLARFPIFAELAEAGATEYVGFLVKFGDGRVESAAGGIVSSWTTRASGGFTQDQVAALRWILHPLALTMRVAIKDQIARTALETFHGALVGNRILSGTIKRGAGERIRTAIWYSDLRNSTGLADALPIDRFLAVLNAYCECTAGAILDAGGQVLEIIGDAVLGIFPVLGEVDTETACARALDAARDAHDRLRRMRAEGRDGAEHIAFGIGLHLGEVIFGNVGTEGRLNFGLVGRVVNEAARTEEMTKALARPVLVTDPVAQMAPDTLDDLGLHSLRGVPAPQRLWSLRLPVPA